MKIVLAKSSTQDIKTKGYVVFVSEEQKKAKLEGKSAAEKAIAQKLTKYEGLAKGKNKVTVFRALDLHGVENLIVIGIGKEEDFSAETVRQALAEAHRALASEKIEKAHIDMRTLENFKLDTESLGQAAAEGLVLASYTFDELKGHSDKKAKASKKEAHYELMTNGKDKALERGLKQGQIIAEATNFARRLGDMPANLMTPSILAQEAKNIAKGTDLKVTVWDKARIKKERMESFLGVNLGSHEEAKFIIMEYRGAAASKKPLCYVGKGLTFDCGGISIKPAAGMEEMKYDMCGGASVIGTMGALARLKAKVNVIAYIPATENLIGPEANKPGDVRIARNGISIEVNNTDAEGRLILADALVYASEQKPKWICTAATLTGAIVVALGNIHTGYFTRSRELAKEVETAAEQSEELIWRMPLTDFHAEDMKGTYADLSNLANSRGAGSATAAAFLEQFVDKSVPFAHFDIAGTAWNAGNRFNYFPKKGATGAIIRTFIQMALNEQ